MTILVTGATGQVGGALVRALAGTSGVRAFVRAEHALSDVEIVRGSFGDQRALTRAMDGVELLFLAGRDDPRQVELHRGVLAVARAAGVRHVVKLSALGARADSPVALMRWHHEVEQRLRDSAFAWTFLRPHLYMQNLLRFAGAVAAHRPITAPMGDGRFPLVDTRDVGAAAAAILRDPARHAGQAYALTGPVALSYDEVAERLAAVVRHPVRYDAQPPGAFRAALVAAGVPQWRADDLAAIAHAYDAADNVPSGDVAALLGRPPAALETFFGEHRAAYAAGGHL